MTRSWVCYQRSNQTTKALVDCRLIIARPSYQCCHFRCWDNLLKQLTACSCFQVTSRLSGFARVEYFSAFQSNFIARKVSKSADKHCLTEIWVASRDHWITFTNDSAVAHISEVIKTRAIVSMKAGKTFHDELCWSTFRSVRFSDFLFFSWSATIRTRGEKHFTKISFIRRGNFSQKKSWKCGAKIDTLSTVEQLMQTEKQVVTRTRDIIKTWISFRGIIFHRSSWRTLSSSLSSSTNTRLFMTQQLSGRSQKASIAL